VARGSRLVTRSLGRRISMVELVEPSGTSSGVRAKRGESDRSGVIGWTSLVSRALLRPMLSTSSVDSKIEAPGIAGSEKSRAR
jgi:hypothetical protein